MSSSATPAPGSSNGPTTPQEIRVYQHSQLFYWWPVWLCGFVMAIWTWIDGHRMAIVPADTQVQRTEAGNTFLLKTESKNTQMLDEAAARSKANQRAFPLHVAQNSRLGAIFTIVLLLVIVITNMPLRGLWSVIIIVAVILISIILALADMWDRIFLTLGNLHIYINMAGYFLISIGLFVMWVIAVFFFDRQTYMIFAPGQLRVCLEIGGGETTYDTMGMTIQKYRDDLFRHWILGLGSGDLTVRTAGAQSHEFPMHNVLNVSSKLKQIEAMQREKQTVQVK
jgi:ABC-type multidrug transport system fused ATPase/permease subunit